MGIDYNSCVVVGYIVNTSDFMKFFTLQWHDEVVKEKKRFSEKTGLPLKPIKVVEQEGGYDVYFDGKKLDIEGLDIESDSFDDDDNHFYPHDELLEVIAEALNCNIEVHGDHYNGYYSIAISSKLVSNLNGPSSWGRNSNEFTSFDDVVNAKDDVYRIGEVAKTRGVDLGDPGIYSLLDVC